MTFAERAAAAATVGLAGLQIAWHAWLAPPATTAPWLMAAVFVLPIAPAAILVALGHRRAGFWGAVAALLYFSHGVMAAWASPAERGLGVAEAVLSAVLIVAASWDGLRRRFGRRPATPAGL